MNTKKNKLKLKWEYCECGCHGHENAIFWLFNDLMGCFFLHRGHGWTSPLIGTFRTFEEADVCAYNLYVEDRKEGHKAMINK